MNSSTLTRLATLLFAAAFCANVAAQDERSREDEDGRYDRVELERHLDEKRLQIRELAEEMGRLSVTLADGPIRHIIRSVHGDANRAVLGISIESRSGDDGVYVHAVTPGGPAEGAGVETGDVVVALGGVALAGNGEDHDAMHKLIEIMADVEAGDAVDVTFERDGKRFTRELITERLSDHASVFAFSTDSDSEFNFNFDGDFENFAGLEKLSEFGNFEFGWHSGPWADMELVELTPQLGAYFGVENGLLVVRAPGDASLGVVDGDVIVKLNGDGVSTPREFTRALAKSEQGETIGLDIVRQREAMNLEAQVPEQEKSTGPMHFNRDGKHVIIERRHYLDDD